MLATSQRPAGDNGADAPEFVLEERDFRTLCELANKHTGIVLNESKRNMVYSRLARRLRQLGLPDFAAYCQRLQSGDKQEFIEFINSITTNLTSFFREPHHFEHLQRELMPMLLRERAQERRIRVWSAGCSTGEEPYSIAMAIMEVLPQDWDLRVLATDLDTHVLAHAEAGSYSLDRMRDIAPERLKHWFLKGSGDKSGKARVADGLRERIQFRQVNLIQPWPVRGPLDVVFCRNVVIYFDKATQRELFDRFADVMASGSHLYIGHSETLFRVSERFESLGRTIYRRLS